MNRPAAWAWLAAACGWAFLSPARADEIDFVRVHVPAAGLHDVPLEGGRYLPMPLTDFEAAVARLGPGGGPARQPVAATAHYRLSLDPDGGLAGTLEFQIAAAAELPSQIPLGEVFAAAGTLVTAEGSGAATIFCLADGSMAVQIAGPGRYACGIRLPAAAGDVVRLPLVPALVTTIEMDLPAAVRPIAVGAAASVTLVEPAAERPGSWRIVRGPVGPDRTLPLVFWDGRRQPAPVRAWNGVTARGRQAEIVARIEPAAPWTPDRLELSVPAPLVVTAATAAGADLPWTRVDGGIVVAPPDRLVGSREAIVIAALVPVAVGEPTVVPVIRPAPGRWAGCGVRLAVDPTLAVQRVELSEAIAVTEAIAARWPLPARPAAAPAAGLESALVYLEHQAPTADASVVLGPREASFETVRVTTVDISPGTVLGRTTADVRVVAGQLFGITADIAADWFIDSVEAIDAPRGRDGDAPAVAGRPLEWRVVRSPQGSELRIGLPAAAAPGRDVSLRVTGHRSGLPLGAEFSSDQIDMVRFPAETAMLEFQVGPTAVLEAAGQPLGVEPLPERLAALASLAAPRARIAAGDRAPAVRARLVRRRPPVEAEVRVELVARDERLAEKFTFTCRPVAGELDAVVVHFSEPVGAGLEWAMADPLAGSLSAQLLDPADPTRGELRTEAAVAESWLVELRPASAAAVTFRAARTVRLEAPVPLPLAWVEAAEDPGGTVAIRGEAGQRPEVDNRGLPELPPGADAEVGTVELTYGAPRTLAGADPAATVLPPSVAAAARAWAWRQATNCWCHEAGGLAWETNLEVENHGRESVTVTIPSGLKIEEVIVDDEPVAAVPSGADAAGLVVPLPRTGGLTTLVVRGVGRRDDRLGWWRIGGVVCGVDMPVLERAVQLMLPPGLVTTVPADDRDWLGRLFGGGIGGVTDASAGQRGFRAVALPDAGPGGTGPLVIRRRLLWSVAIGVGSLAALATMRVTRRSGPAAVAACCIAAVAALWCPAPWDLVARTALWGSIVGSWAATPWRPGPRAAIAALLALAVAGPAGPSTHAGEDPPLRVFVTPGPEGGTALVPESLFRRLSAATAGPPSLRVLASELVSPGGGEAGPWTLGLELEADPGGLLVIDQTGSGATWGRVADPPPGLNVSFAGQGRVARIVTAVAGRHRLMVELVPEPTRTGAVEETIVNLPPAPRATLRIDEPAVVNGRRVGWQCDRAGPDGGWLPAGGGGVFDVAATARVRLVRPVDSRVTLAAGLDAAVSFNDIAWRSDDCLVTASFDVGAEATIVRQLIVRADPRLVPVAPADGGPSLRPLGGGRHLVEIPQPQVGQRRVVVELRMPLADPVGVFDAPFAWLEDVESDVRTARLRPEPGLDATVELPAGTAPVRPRLEDGATTTAVWRSDAVATEGAATADPGPRITVRRQPRRPRASQSLLVSLSEDHVGLRLRYQVDALDAPLVEIPVQLPPAAIIDEVALTRQRPGDDADRTRRRVDLVWSRIAADRIVAVVQRPQTGSFRFALDARLPIRPASRGRLPVARIVDPGLPLELRWRAAPGIALTVTDPARPEGPLVRDRLELASPQPAPTYALARAEPPPLPVAAGDTAAPSAAVPPAEASLPLTTIDLAIDAGGRAWGLARFDLLVREPLVTIRVPPGLRLFDLRVDGREVTATPLGGNAWQIRLHDVGWPRSLVAVIAGGLGGRLADGEPIRLEPPRLEGLPPAAVAWALQTPSDLAVRVSEPARVLDEEAFVTWTRRARTRIDEAFAAAIGTTTGGHRRRLDAYANGVRAGAGPGGERDWYEAWRGSAAPESQRVRIVAADDGTVTLRAVPVGFASSAATRGLVTAAILAGGATLWLAARRYPRAWSMLMPRLSRWWWLACGAAWLLLHEPPLPGLVMVALGIWLALPRREVERGAGAPPAGDDSTLTLAGG